MPFDGSGNYTPAAAPNFPAIAGTTISSTYYNAVINDIAVALGNCLTRDGQGKPSTNINWNAKNLTNIATLAAATLQLTNALGISYGGTGLSGTPTNGQLLIGNGTGYTLATLSAGSGVSITNSAGGVSIAATGSGGTVTSVQASGGSTGLTFSGGPITGSGTLTLGGTLAVGFGGTGSTTVAGAQTNLQVYSKAQIDAFFANPSFSGSITEGSFTITDAAAFEINPGNGTMQVVTLGANRTPKGTSFANGQSVTLAVDDGTGFTLTWTDTTFGASGVKWLGGSAPTLATTGYTWITLWKFGGQVYGSTPGSSA